MYQTDFICTYKMLDDETDQEVLYRIQLLQAFDLEQWNINKINEMIAELYKSLAETDEFKELFQKSLQNKNILELLNALNLFGDDIIFKLLFKYDFFDLLHRCIADHLTNGKINEKNFTNLLNAL